MGCSGVEPPYATREQLVTLRPDLASEPRDRVCAALDYVSWAMRGLCEAEAVDVSGIDPSVLSLVACQAASRMLSAGDAPGVKQESWGASPYSASVTWDNPSGDVYLTAFEKRLLGVDGAAMRAEWANPSPAGEADDAQG